MRVLPFFVTCFARYAGLSPSLVGIVPYSGLNFAIYEGLKEMVVRRTWKIQSSDHAGLVVNLSCGALAGLIAQTATYPLHVLRRRQQVCLFGGDSCACRYQLCGNSIFVSGVLLSMC